MKEQTRNIEVQINEKEIGKLPEKNSEYDGRKGACIKQTRKPVWEHLMLSDFWKEGNFAARKL